MCLEKTIENSDKEKILFGIKIYIKTPAGYRNLLQGLENFYHINEAYVDEKDLMLHGTGGSYQTGFHILEDSEINRSISSLVRKRFIENSKEFAADSAYYWSNEELNPIAYVLVKCENITHFGIAPTKDKAFNGEIKCFIAKKITLIEEIDLVELKTT